MEFPQFGRFAPAEQDERMVVHVRKAHDAIEPDIEERHPDRLRRFHRAGLKRWRHSVEHAQPMKRDVIELLAAQPAVQAMLMAKLPGEMVGLSSRGRRQAEAEEQIFELPYPTFRQHELFAA